MRGIPSLITDIRKNVFTEVARMAYNGGDYTQAEDLPFKIVPGDQPLHGSLFSWNAPSPESGCGLPWVWPSAPSRPAA